MNEKKSKLAQYLLQTKGIVDPTIIEAEIAKMANNLPAAVAAEKGITDVVDKAYEVLLIEQNQVPVTETQPAVSTAPSPAASSAETLQVAKVLQAQKQEREAVSRNTVIDKLLIDRPAPSDVIPAGTMGIIKDKGWESFIGKVNSGEFTVLPDDGEAVPAEKRIASTTNFNKLKAAYEAKTPVEVYIGSMSTRPIGYLALVGDAVGTSQSAKPYTRDKFEQFLIMKTNGYVLASGAKPAAKLRYVKPKANSMQPGMVSEGKTILADCNKQAAIEAGNYDVTRQTTSEIQPTTAKTADRIRVSIKGKTNKDGTPKVVTKRLSVTTDLPVLERKPIYIEVFGTGLRASNESLEEVPQGDQAKKIAMAQQQAVLMLRRKASNPETLSDVSEIADQLAAFDTPASQAPAGVVM